MDEAVTLAAGELEARLQATGAGLTVASLRHCGEELLLAPGELPPEWRIHGALAGIALLHPWANRLSADAFDVAGGHVTLPADPALVARDPQGLPLHGLSTGGWQLAAAAGADGTRRAVAELRFGAGPEGAARLACFPFPHTVTVEATIGPAGLALATTVRATGEKAVPVAFGWHPFVRLPGAPRGRWQIVLPERHVLVLDGRGMPTGEHHPQAFARFPLDARRFDDAYDAVADGATFAAAAHGRELRVRPTGGFPAAQFFAPRELGVVAFEPMTAPVNALVTGHGLRLLTPGETLCATFEVAVVAARLP